MNKAYCLIITVAWAALIPSACRKTSEEAAGPAAPPAPDTAALSVAGVRVEGTYAGGGVAPDGNAYHCEAEITPARDVYWVMYHVDERTPYAGVAMRRGALFVVGYRDEREVYGVVAYTIKPDGSLEGVSADEKHTTTGTERLAVK